MEVLFKIFNEYGWWGILGIVLCIGLFWMSKYISKKLTSNVTTGLEKVGMTLTDQIAKQNEQLTVTIAKSQEKLIDYLINNEDKKQKNHNNMLNDRMVLSEDINQALKDIMNIHNSQRAFILEFHNSYQNLSGIPFAKYSCNFEWFDKGLTSLCNVCSGIAFSTIARVVSDLNKSPNKQVVYTDINKLEEDCPALMSFIKKDNPESLIYTGMYDRNNMLIGLLVLEYQNEINPKKINLHQLHVQAAELTSILNIRYKYNNHNEEL